METDQSFSGIVFDPDTAQQQTMNGGFRPDDADSRLLGAIGQLVDPDGYVLSHIVEAQSYAELSPAPSETSLLTRVRNIAGYVGNLASRLFSPDPRSIIVDRNRDDVMRQVRGLPRF